MVLAVCCEKPHPSHKSWKIYFVLEHTWKLSFPYLAMEWESFGSTSTFGPSCAKVLSRLVSAHLFVHSIVTEALVSVGAYES